MRVELVSGLIERLRLSCQDAINRWRARSELAGCSASELCRIAADVGVSGEELRRLHLHEFGPSELLPRRLQLLGVDPEFTRRAAPAAFRELARVCASCRATRRCARDLAAGDVQAGMDAYCSNGPTIDALTVRSDWRALH
jgi:hypothetical protein